jgi:hypothetical protein
MYPSTGAHGMTPAQYALNEFRAERHPDIGIYAVAGDFWLTDTNSSLLKARPFTTREAAITARSKAIDAALKRRWRAA